MIQTAGLAQELPSATHWLPADAVIVLDVSDPLALLNPILSPEMAKAITALPAYQKQIANPKLWQLSFVLAYLETQLHTDWRSGLRSLLGRGFTLATGPTGEALLCVDAQDEKLLKQLHEMLRNVVSAEAGKQNQPDRVAAHDYRGVTTWSFGTNETHVILNHRLLLANRPQALNRALDLRAEPGGKSLARSLAYQAARQALGKETVATLFLDMQAFKQHPRLKQVLARDPNPLAALLLADAKDAFRQANWLAFGLYIKENKLTVKIVTDGRAPDPPGPGSFASPRHPDEGVLPNLDLPESIVGLSLYRDLHGFYAAKNELFPERTSGLIFFENMMGIFFSGLDLTEQVLGETRPEIRVVAAAQQYDPAIGTPAVQLPAFAFVLLLRHPQAFGEVVEEAWQKAVGLVNFTRGQKAEPGLIIDRVPYGAAKLTVAYYRAPTNKEPAAIHARYNFRPTLARPDDYLILSSTDGLARELIDALKKESASPPKPLPKSHTLMEVDGAQLLASLSANRTNMVRKNMVDKGNTQAQAEAEVGLLFTALDCLRQARFSLGQENGHPQASLELQLKLPDAERIKTARVEAKKQVPAR